MKTNDTKYYVLSLIPLTLFSCVFPKSAELSVNYVQPLKTYENDRFLAGAASVDITPPPGMPMAGYGAISDYGKGVRTKLKARVIYLKPKKGNSVAIVQCDLLSGSTVLHHKLAEMIAPTTDIDAAGLLVVATHTHSAPGNYFESVFYNAYASNNSGFEQQYFEFLTTKISQAIQAAYDNRRAAKIATAKAEIHGMTRNRSFAAYLKNKNINSENPPDKYEAVNPDLYITRIDALDNDQKFKPLAVFSNYSLHPNVKPQNLDSLYTGDIFAFIEREVEWGITRDYAPSWKPVHAAMNLTHGDNNPNLPENISENFTESQKLGTKIGQFIYELVKSLENKLSDDPVIEYRATEIDVLKYPTYNDVTLCDRAVVGCALLAGAEHKSTLLYYIPPFSPGWPRIFFTGSCQGHKRTAFGPLQYLYLPKDEFPHVLFIQAIRIHDSLLMPVPFEVCFEAGRRLAKQAEETSKTLGITGINNYLVFGCSNGYWGYLTTPEEYTLQHYEGGHTLYGPNTGAYVRAVQRDLIGSFLDSKPQNSTLPDHWSFDFKISEYYPKRLDYSGKRETYEEPSYVSKDSDDYWTFQWIDVPPCLIALDQELVRIEFKEDGSDLWRPLVKNSVPVNDDGYDISIIHMNKLTNQNMGIYQTKWHNPEKKQGVSYRFAILPRQDQDIFYSPAFNT